MKSGCFHLHLFLENKVGCYQVPIKGGSTAKALTQFVLKIFHVMTTGAAPSLGKFSFKLVNHIQVADLG